MSGATTRGSDGRQSTCPLDIAMRCIVHCLPIILDGVVVWRLWVDGNLIGKCCCVLLPHPVSTSRSGVFIGSFSATAGGRRVDIFFNARKLGLPPSVSNTTI